MDRARNNHSEPGNTTEEDKHHIFSLTCGFYCQIIGYVYSNLSTHGGRETCRKPCGKFAGKRAGVQVA